MKAHLKKCNHHTLCPQAVAFVHVSMCSYVFCTLEVILTTSKAKACTASPLWVQELTGGMPDGQGTMQVASWIAGHQAETGQPPLLPKGMAAA